MKHYRDSGTRRGRPRLAKTLAARAAISITSLCPFVSKDPLWLVAYLPSAWPLPAAVSLAGCQFVRDDINRSLGRGPEEQSRRSDIAASQVTTIGVNAYLWRAALDTLSFAPLAQTDSNGGVIVTDWYANPQNPSERAKVTVTILDRDLRADALRVNAAAPDDAERPVGRCPGDRRHRAAARGHHPDPRPRPEARRDRALRVRLRT